MVEINQQRHATLPFLKIDMRHRGHHIKGPTEQSCSAPSGNTTSQGQEYGVFLTFTLNILIFFYIPQKGAGCVCSRGMPLPILPDGEGHMVRCSW